MLAAQCRQTSEKSQFLLATIRDRFIVKDSPVEAITPYQYYWLTTHFPAVDFEALFKERRYKVSSHLKITPAVEGNEPIMSFMVDKGYVKSHQSITFSPNIFYIVIDSRDPELVRTALKQYVDFDMTEQPASSRFFAHPLAHTTRVSDILPLYHNILLHAPAFIERSYTQANLRILFSDSRYDLTKEIVCGGVLLPFIQHLARAPQSTIFKKIISSALGLDENALDSYDGSKDFWEWVLEQGDIELILKVAESGRIRSYIKRDSGVPRKKVVHDKTADELIIFLGNTNTSSLTVKQRVRLLNIIFMLQDSALHIKRGRIDIWALYEVLHSAASIRQFFAAPQESKLKGFLALRADTVRAFTKHSKRRSRGTLSEFARIEAKRDGVIGGFIARKDGEVFMVKEVGPSDMMRYSKLPTGFPLMLQDIMTEYIISPLYERVLPKRSPVIGIVTAEQSEILSGSPPAQAQESDDFIRVSSRFIADGRRGAILLKNLLAYQADARLDGLEDVLASNIRFGNDDDHGGNLMVIQKASGRYQVRVIDLGRAGGLNIMAAPQSREFSSFYTYSYSDVLRARLNYWSVNKYNLRLNLRTLRIAMEHVLHSLPKEEYVRQVKGRVFELYEAFPGIERCTEIHPEVLIRYICEGLEIREAVMQDIILIMQATEMLLDVMPRRYQHHIVALESMCVHGRRVNPIEWAFGKVFDLSLDEFQKQALVDKIIAVFNIPRFRSFLFEGVAGATPLFSKLKTSSCFSAALPEDLDYYLLQHLRESQTSDSAVVHTALHLAMARGAVREVMYVMSKITPAMLQNQDSPLYKDYIRTLGWALQQQKYSVLQNMDKVLLVDTMIRHSPRCIPKLREYMTLRWLKPEEQKIIYKKIALGVVQYVRVRPGKSLQDGRRLDKYYDCLLRAIASLNCPKEQSRVRAEAAIKMAEGAVLNLDIIARLLADSPQIQGRYQRVAVAILENTSINSQVMLERFIAAIPQCEHGNIRVRSVAPMEPIRLQFCERLALSRNPQSILSRGLKLHDDQTAPEIIRKRLRAILHERGVESELSQTLASAVIRNISADFQVLLEVAIRFHIIEKTIGRGITVYPDTEDKDAIVKFSERIADQLRTCIQPTGRGKPMTVVVRH